MSRPENIEVVEVYVPRNLEYLSPLYLWLKTELSQPESRALFRGFSLYEVSGAYVGSIDYTEQTLIVPACVSASRRRSRSSET